MLIVGIIIAVILIIALIIYVSLKKSLARQLGLKVELDPPHVEKGKDVKVRVILHPKEATKVESITGTLFCRRYDEFKNSWQYKTDNTHLAKGKTITRIEFTFGQNIELYPGKEAKFGGVVPLPSEGMATEIRGIIQVHWFVTIHVKVPGSPIAEVQEELIVMRPLILDGEEEGEGEGGEDVDLYDPFYDATEAMKKSIVLIPKKSKKKEVKPGDKKAKPVEKVPVATVTGAKSIKTPEKSDASKLEKKEKEKKKKKEKEKPLTQEDIRDKYKIKYHAPFDPTKFKKESRPVTSEEYIKSITSPEKEEKHAEPGEVADIYKKRYFVSSKDKDKKSKKIDLKQIPEEYRTHYKLAKSSREQKIIDEKNIPNEYRSGYKKPKKDDLPKMPDK